MTNSPNSATWFGTYEFAKTHLHRLGWLDPTIEQLACGAMAGFASVVVSNPLDVVRTLVQTSPASTKMSIVGTISRQVRTQGTTFLMLLNNRLSKRCGRCSWPVPRDRPPINDIRSGISHNVCNLRAPEKACIKRYRQFVIVS